MKIVQNTALFLLISIFYLPQPVRSQSTIATDSLTVKWEQLDGPSGEVIKYAECDGQMLAATSGGLYYSKNQGLTWKFNHALGKKNILRFDAIGNTIVVVVKESFSAPALVYCSQDKGATWKMTFNSDGRGTHLSSAYKANIYGINDSVFIYRLNDYGTYAWKTVDKGLSWAPCLPPSTSLYNTYSVGDVICGFWYRSSLGKEYAFIAPQGDFFTAQNVDISQLPSFNYSTSLLYFQNGLFSIILEDGEVYQTTDLGGHWTTSTLPFTGKVKGGFFQDSLCVLWTEGNERIWSTNRLEAPFNFSLIYHEESGDNQQVGTFFKGSSGYWLNNSLLTTVFSPDNGLTWEIRSKGLKGKVANLTSFCGKIVTTTGSLFPTDRRSQFFSNQEDGGWQTASGLDFKRILGEANGVVYSYFPPRRSVDCGISWDTINYPDITIQAAPDKIIQDGDRVYLFNQLGVPQQYSDDNGLSWLEVPEPTPFLQCFDLIPLGDTLILLARGNISNQILYRSFDRGQSWQSIPIPIPFPWINHIYYAGEGKLVAQRINKGDSAPYIPSASLFISPDLGITWDQTFFTDKSYPYLIDQFQLVTPLRFPLIDNGTILLHAEDGVFISQNAGRQWTRLLNLPFSNFAVDGFVEGAICYLITDGYLYAGTESQGIWRTPFAPIRDHLRVQNKEYGFLKGRLFRDGDGDCMYNPAENDRPIGQKPVMINPGNILTTTDANGQFSIALPVGRYAVSAAAPANYSLTCATDSAAVIVGQTVGADLPFTAIPGIRDVSVLITTPVAARPGFEVTYKIQVLNRGTVPVSGGVLTFSFEEDYLTPISCLPGGQFSGNKVEFTLSELAVGDGAIFTLVFRVNPATPLGTVLHFNAECPDSGDVNPNNNTDHVTQIVRGSFDPNDKNALPLVPQPPGQPRLLDYLIRFQNTGTDTAFTVVVTDTIEDGLNLLSIRTIESSGLFEFSILPNRVCKWRFPNILLPDSTTNEPGSHGYLRFQIETNPGLVPGTPIRNNARIFFDFNSPVRTNEAVSDNPKWKVTEYSTVVLCAGDTWNGEIWNNNAIHVDSLGTVWSDTISYVNIEVLPTWSLHFDTTITRGSVFLNSLISQDTTITELLQAANGCDSTVVWDVHALVSGVTDIENTDNVFKLFPNPAGLGVWIGLVQPTNFPSNTCLRLENATGKTLKVLENVELSSSTPYYLDITDLPQGIYFVFFQSPQYSGAKKFVKF